MITTRIFVVAMIAALMLEAIADSQEGKQAPSEKKTNADESRPPAIQWRTDYPAARKESEDKKLPILILVIRLGNPPSARLVAEMADHTELLRYINARMVPVLVVGPDERKLVADLGISLYPTTMIADRDGKILKTKIGYYEPSELLADLQTMSKAKSKPEK